MPVTAQPVAAAPLAQTAQTSQAAQAATTAADPALIGGAGAVAAAQGAAAAGATPDLGAVVQQLVAIVSQLVQLVSAIVAQQQSGGSQGAASQTAGGAAAAPAAPVGAPIAAPIADAAPASPNVSTAAYGSAMPGVSQALQGAGTVKAIDVSNHQGDIDWKAVRGDGVRVAYMKASEGKDYVDSTYANNRKGAAAQGIVTGAYDFARPGSTNPGDVVADAKAEAEHFLKAANVRKGDLAPALDLEATGNLNKSQLAQWVKTWGETVKAATGTTPTLYTSPSFWESKVGNADAAKGFKLWIAHWGVSSPTVPAGWQSWAGWQTGSSGSVSGIKGRVDTDLAKDPASMLVGA